MKYFKNEYPNNIIIFDQDTNKVVCRLMHYDFNNEEEAIKQAEKIIEALNREELELIHNLFFKIKDEETEVIENSFFIIISQEEAIQKLKKCECIYRIYPDGTESLIEDENGLNDAIKDNCLIGIEKEETKDLFENYEAIPEEVKSILEHFGDLEAMTYEELAGLQKNLETIGYTFDYGLDAQPFNLRKI